MVGISQTPPTTISGYEVLETFQRTFSRLQVGKNLFITTGEYQVFSLNQWRQSLTDIYTSTSIPQCRFKAASVYLGRLHEELGELVAAGYAMTNGSPPWMLIFLATGRCERIKMYVFDPVKNPTDSGSIQEILTPSAIKLILF